MNCKLSKFSYSVSILLYYSVTMVSVTAKSVSNEQYYPQIPGMPPTEKLQYQRPANYQPQQHDTYQSPSYPEYDENMESYEYPSSEEAPVKNSHFVPVETPEEALPTGNSTEGHIPQRQVSLQQIWQNPLFQQHVNTAQGVTDEGIIELGNAPVALNNQSSPYVQHGVTVVELVGGSSLSSPQNQYFQQQQHNAVREPNIYAQQQQPEPHPSTSSTTSLPVHPPTLVPTPKRKSSIHKLVVESRKTSEGKIAVVKDITRLSRNKRQSPMMSLSRLDENESEYDDLSDVSADDRSPLIAFSRRNSTRIQKSI